MDPPLPPDTVSNDGDKRKSDASTETTDPIQTGSRGGVPVSVKRRRRSSRTSFGLRRRHNAVLKATTEWLVGRGATSIILDKPLYKNDLLSRELGPKALQRNLKKKSRAPDLVCTCVDPTLGEESLVVVEVAVASNPDKVRAQKSSKYLDLIALLECTNKPCRLATIVVQDDGRIPDGTRSDIYRLADLTAGIHNKGQDEVEAETDQLCTHLGSIVSSYRDS